MLTLQMIMDLSVTPKKTLTCTSKNLVNVGTKRIVEGRVSINHKFSLEVSLAPHNQ